MKVFPVHLHDFPLCSNNMLLSYETLNRLKKHTVCGCFVYITYLLTLRGLCVARLLLYNNNVTVTY